MTTIILFGSFLILLILSVPIGFAIGISTIVTIVTAVDSVDLITIAQKSFTSLDSFTLLAIPFFILAGVLMSKGGISESLLKLADSLVGSFSGGLAMITIVTCTFFAAISGSGPATVAAVGIFMIPAMIKENYGEGFAAGITSAAGAIGVIIPPSIPFILYGVIAQVSIGDLFLAGIIPGMLIALSLMIASYFIVKNRLEITRIKKKFSVKIFIQSFYNAIWALLAPVIILGGIYKSIFTATEASAIAVLYSIIVGVFVYKKINLRNFIDSIIETLVIVGAVVYLVGLSVTFAYLLSLERIPEKISASILSLTDNTTLILLLIIAILLFVGAFIDTVSAIVIFTPIFLPVSESLGIHPVHFGVIMVATLAIGFITPPVGANLFVASQIGKVPIEKVFVSTVPLVLVMIITLIILVVFPKISLFLPSLS